jgi:hypothetical protein
MAHSHSKWKGEQARTVVTILVNSRSINIQAREKLVVEQLLT